MTPAQKKKQILSHVNRVATTHYMVRHRIEASLKQWTFPVGDPIRNLIGPQFNNYFEYWTHTYDDRFFDMGTFTRLGSVLETGFRDFYMQKKGHQNVVALKNDPVLKNAGNIFQRIKPSGGGSKNLQSLYMSELGIDLEAIPGFSDIKEFFIHRHLYTHNSGVVDDHYINDLKAVSGIDLSAEFTPIGYPAEDCMWFNPLKDLDRFIEAARKVFTALPE